MPLGLVQLVPVVPQSTTPLPRLWLIFFGDADRAWWWTRLFRPGFRHVSAAAWFADTERWVYFNPTGPGTVIQVATDAEFGPRFQQLVQDSTAILRMPSRHSRGMCPAAFFCVGAIKALLGVKSRALTPFGLFRHLVAEGAEIVERPEDDLGLSRARPATAAAATADSRSGGGPVDHGGTRAPETARRGGQNPGDAEPIAARNAAA